MQKKSASQSGIFNTRVIIAVALCSVGLSLGWFSFASTPPSGTISVATPSFTYTAGPFDQANPSPLGAGQFDTGPRCDSSTFPCDTFALAVNLPSNYLDNTSTGHPQASVKVTMSWVDAGTGKSDYDLYIYKLPRSDCFSTSGTASPDCSQTDGAEAANYQSASSNNPEVATISPLVADGTDHHYTVHIVPYTPTGETVTVKIELLPGPAGGSSGGGGGVPFGTADATAPGVPRFMNFYAPDGTSAQSSNGEFNIGFNPHSGRIMVMNIGPIWRITPHEVVVPGAPECCEGLWEDKSATVTNTGLDPILWTDQKSGRTFASNSTAGANAVYAYTDSDGDATATAPTGWTPFGIAAPNGGADHETIGSGPYPALLSALGTAANQGEAVYYCSQDVVGPAACYRSDTLGASYGASTLAYNGQGSSVPGGTCGGLHGHLHVAPDGTVWLPVNQCSGLQGGVFSTDGGTTWNTFQVPNGFSQQQGADPSIAIDANNTIYYAYVKNEPVAVGNPPEGHAHVAVGNRVGTTVNWVNDIDVGRNVGGTVLNGDHGIINAAEIEAVGGSAGRAGIGFLGTDQPGDYQALSFPGKWYAFIATTYDGGAHWTTVNATPNDPVQSMTGVWQQGGSAQDRNLLDFNEITIDDRGRVLYGYSDGCVSTGCIAGTAGNDFTAFMRVARQTGGKSLFASYDGNTDTTAAILPKAPCLSGTRDSTGSHLTWKAPDNGGAVITQYQIFRGTTSGGEAPTPIGFSATTKFDDTTALPSVPDYFYIVKAINSVGTGPASNEIDLQVTIIQPINPCAAPGVLLLTDPAGDSTAQAAEPATDLLSASVIQPYAPDGNIKLIFTINTTPEPNGNSSKTPGVGWYLAMKIPNGIGGFNYTGVRMDGFPTGPTFSSYVPGPNTSGTVDGRFVASSKPADPSSSYNPNTGVITIIVPASDLGLSAGSQIAGIVSASTQTTDVGGVGGATVILDQMPDGTNPTFTAPPPQYQAVNPNSVCAPNTAPLAALSASPTQGDPPLFVTFTPSGTDADPGDTIASYTIDFGDGSAPVTQSCSATCPQITHTYTTNGDFGVQLKVTDSRGKLSSNTALLDIESELPLDRVESSKMHGTKGPFPVVLYDLSVHPDGSGEIECRTEGNGYTLIYSFGSCPGGNCEFTITGSASSPPTVTNGATVASHGPGPGPNQYQVQLTGVTNAQYHFVTLNGVPVHNNTNGGDATLNDAGAQLPLLVGDVNGSKLVDGNDVSAVQAKTRQAATSSNFRLDVNASGLIDGNDVSVTQGKTRTSLPH
jgi:hypothetical protein